MELHPEPRYFLALPNIRLSPSWYADQRLTILRHLSNLLQSSVLPISTIRSFIMTAKDFEPDGVHFLPLQGIAYCQWLIDQPR